MSKVYSGLKRLKPKVVTDYPRKKKLAKRQRKTIVPKPTKAEEVRRRKAISQDIGRRDMLQRELDKINKRLFLLGITNDHE